MATVTMELAELDMLKRNAKETEQKLNEKNLSDNAKIKKLVAELTEKFNKKGGK